MGGGLELALSCDFRLARDGEFAIGLPETGVGILPGGGTQRLARLIGTAHALDLILHGRVMTPNQALQFGIVHRVFPNDLLQYRDAVNGFVSNLAARAPRALANAKRAIRDGIEMSLSEGLRREAELFAELMATERRRQCIGCRAKRNCPTRIQRALRTCNLNLTTRSGAHSTSTSQRRIKYEQRYRFKIDVRRPIKLT